MLLPMSSRGEKEKKGGYGKALTEGEKKKSGREDILIQLTLPKRGASRKKRRGGGPTLRNVAYYLFLFFIMFISTRKEVTSIATKGKRGGKGGGTEGGGWLLLLLSQHDAILFPAHVQAKGWEETGETLPHHFSFPPLRTKKAWKAHVLRRGDKRGEDVSLYLFQSQGGGKVGRRIPGGEGEKKGAIVSEPSFRIPLGTGERPSPGLRREGKKKEKETDNGSLV